MEKIKRNSCILDNSSPITELYTFKNFPVRVAGRYITLGVTSIGSSDDYIITDMVIQGRFEGER